MQNAVLMVGVMVPTAFDACPADAGSPPNPKASIAVRQLAAVNLTMPVTGARLELTRAQILAFRRRAGALLPPYRRQLP
jgi:hypothetical protein